MLILAVEPSCDATAVALVRDGRTYLLTIEPGKVVPTGRAERIRVKEDGQVQGTDAAGRLVTDVNLANIPLFLFDNPARLQSADGVLFTPTPFSGEPRQVKIMPGSKGVIMPGKVMLSNGKPEEIFARISTPSPACSENRAAKRPKLPPAAAQYKAAERQS